MTLIAQKSFTIRKNRKGDAGKDAVVYSVRWLLNGVAVTDLNYTVVKSLSTAELQALFYKNGAAFTAAKAVIGCYDAAGNLMGSPIELSDTSGSVIDGGNLYLSKDTLNINCKLYDSTGNELCDTSLPVKKDGDKGDSYQPNLLKGANKKLSSSAYFIGQYAWDGSKPADGTLCTLTVCYKVDSADTLIKVFQDSGNQLITTLTSTTEKVESFTWTYKAFSGLSAAQLLQFTFFHETARASSYASGTYVKWAVVTTGNAAATAWVPAASEMVGQKGDKGDKGDTGATGPQGPKGDKGDTGAAGKDGKDGKDGSDATVAPWYELEPTRESVSTVIEDTKMRIKGKLTYDNVIIHSAAGEEKKDTFYFIANKNMRLRYKIQEQQIGGSTDKTITSDFTHRAATDNAPGFPGTAGKTNKAMDFETNMVCADDGYYPVYMRVQLYDATNTDKVYAERTFKIGYNTKAVVKIEQDLGIVQSTATSNKGDISQLKQKADEISAAVNDTSIKLTQGNFTIKAGVTRWLDNNGNEVATIRDDGTINFEKLKSNNGEFSVDKWGNVMTGVQTGLATAQYIVEDKSNLVFDQNVKVYLPNDPEYIGRRVLIFALPKCDSAGYIHNVDGTLTSGTITSSTAKVQIETGRVFVNWLYGNGNGIWEDNGADDTVSVDASKRRNIRGVLTGTQFFPGHTIVARNAGSTSYASYPRHINLQCGYVELLGVPYTVNLFRIKEYVEDGYKYSVHMSRADDGTIDDTDFTNGLIAETTTTESNTIAASQAGTQWKYTMYLTRWTVINVQAQTYSATA